MVIFTDRVNSSTDKKLALTTSNGRRQCYVEIERSTVKGAILHAKIPSISHTTDTILYLYYDPNAPDNDGYVGDVGSTPAQNVWDSNFKLVCHMVDDPDTSHVKDSTSNGNDGTKKAANEPIEATGKIGKAQDFDGDDDNVNAGNDSTLDLTTAFTLEAWVSADATQESNYASIIHKGSWRYYLGLNNLAVQVYVNDAENIIGSVISADTLTYLVWAHTSASDIIYINGESDTSGNIADVTSAPAEVVGIGGQGGSLISNNFDGVIDEVRISKGVDRSGAWVDASYKTQNNTLIGYGNIENRGASFPKPPQAPQPPINIGLFFRLKDWLAHKVAEQS